MTFPRGSTTLESWNADDFAYRGRIGTRGPRGAMTTSFHLIRVQTICSPSAQETAAHLASAKAPGNLVVPSSIIYALIKRELQRARWRSKINASIPPGP